MSPTEQPGRNPSAPTQLQDLAAPAHEESPGPGAENSSCLTTTATTATTATTHSGACQNTRRNQQNPRKHRRIGPFRVSTLLATAGLLILCTLLVMLHLLNGEYPLSPREVAQAILGTGEARARFIVVELRLPRPLVAIGVGITLGMAGVLLQNLTRNPLAAPELLGVSAGANLAVVSTVYIFPSLPAATLLPAALMGGFMAAGLVFFFSWKKTSSPSRLLLTGIGVTAGAQALTLAVITTAPIVYASRIVGWLAGSVYAKDWTDARLIGIALVVLTPLAFSLARRADLLTLGDDLSISLGISLERTRITILATGVALAATATAIAGPVAFAGLLCPHIARRLGTSSTADLLLVSGAVGGTLVVGADLAGRVLAAPTEIPAGVLVPVLGAPLLLLLLQRRSPS